VASLDDVHRYHDGTKHDFNRFARSLGYLDWASQPAPFRAFAGAPVVSLPFGAAPAGAPLPVVAGDILRHALGLSAWKQFRGSRWSLRVNPSSGNLHPTEAYIVAPPGQGLSGRAGLWHYAPDRHVLEARAALETSALDPGAFLVALTSIHWREAWKYGERAFRYCQHDLGHAIAALRIAADLAGWHARLLPEWPQRDIAALTGVDRGEDYAEAEREEPACVLLVARDRSIAAPDRAALLDAVQAGAWTGRASQLSEDHVQWTFIDEVARATEDPGHFAAPVRRGSVMHREEGRRGEDNGIPPLLPCLPVNPNVRERTPYTRPLVLQRRSALAFDSVTPIDRAGFLRMLSAVMPDDSAPWDALWWDARIHLALFVHRVTDLDPGLYLLPRDSSACERLKAAMRPDFLWEGVSDQLPLVCLARGDARQLSARLSCDQDIASDGFFSLGMIADFDRSLEEFGPSFYRHLFWEAGVVGQVLYLEAEAAGARGTGIGCFYDDPVHAILGLTGHAFQSLYHFTIGRPIEDTRLETTPGYPDF
jgi:SagB-type dehydrogenase family enzyme